jgi:transcription-repair coupling factor (superfamily II helicase)
VAILVPTTILAEQHYLTFKERFADYPIKIEMLSRFRSKKEQDKIISELKRGIVDIIIGTHRLIQGDIEFRDLGLVIIDEEQRFGLRHKEKLKQIKRLVDVLTLTATPIPRTLYLSLSGARDLSTIETPPLNRLAIQTFVLPFHRATVKEAILRELNRQGQVFFVHNRVKSITLAARYIKSLIPEAKVAIAHGQMKGKDLEKVMHQFLHQQIDVLVATSIIESGLDFPNVNTILINNAHRFGLADLYQLRGRVGRSYHQAYAYLFYPPYQPLTKEARKRLQTIEEFSELSAGFKIALRDLEIRGAGNLLGPEQHGFITSVGFDLYCQLLRETVARLKGEPIEEKEPVEVNIAFKGFIPVSYIEDGEQKLDFYKRLAWLKELEELKKIKSELRDRYGPWPKEVEVLLEVVEIKILAEKIGIKKINGGKKSWQIEWSSKREISPQVFSLAEKFDFKIKSKNPLRLEKISLKKNPFHELKKWLVELTR